ncbi:MAG: hypothetical protein ACOCVO_00775 [bacterium]
MKTLRIAAITILALAAVAGTAAADSVGIGLTVTDGFPAVPSKEEVSSRFFGVSEIDPGVLLTWRDRRAGMSFDFGMEFTGQDPMDSEYQRWWMDLDATATYDWHILPRFVVDPYLQLGAGMDMAVELTDEEPEEIRMAFHPVLGAGLDLNLGHIFLRGNLQYQAGRWLVPDPSIGAYEIAPYRVLLAAGVRLD